MPASPLCLHLGDSANSPRIPAVHAHVLNRERKGSKHSFASLQWAFSRQVVSIMALITPSLVSCNLLQFVENPIAFIVGVVEMHNFRYRILNLFL